MPKMWGVPSTSTAAAIPINLPEGPDATQVEESDDVASRAVRSCQRSSGKARSRSKVEPKARGSEASDFSLRSRTARHSSLRTRRTVT